ncbi:MAG: cation-translocating P-type ATPase [Acholeplasmatales bacterium]|jgi:Cu+-exporting ATPase|nr:cation-translocating P-type ATPase [Acholeplasmatales bacterium]
MKKLYRFYISNMTCSNCSATIKAHFLKLNIKAKINIAAKTLVFLGEENTNFYVKELKKIGYNAISSRKTMILEKIDFYMATSIAGIFLILMILMWFNVMLGFLTSPYLFASLALVAIAIPGRRFIKGFFHDVKNLKFGMNTLIFLGTMASFIYSLVILIINQVRDPMMMNPPSYYFEVSGILIGFMIIGNYVEDRVKRKTNDHLEAFLAQSSKEIEVYRQGSFVNVALENIQVGEIIMVKPGQLVPLDGVLDDQFSLNESEFDEHAITGENTYKFKKIGDRVFAQTINIVNAVYLKVVNTYEDSLFQQIINSAEELASIEPKTKIIANKISSIFVPVVFVIAITGFLLMYLVFKMSLEVSIMRSIAVLVISCPCALGLATPISIISIINTALKEGILIKTSDLFEVGTNIKAVGFDKTGTITSGMLSLVAYHGSLEDLKLAASLEHLFNHPISKAITSYYESLDTFADYLILSEVNMVAGFGLKTTYQTKEVLLGNRNPYEKDKILSDINLELYLIVDHQVVATFVLEDEIKKDAKTLLSDLHKQGIKTYLISGDNVQRTNYIARNLGFSQAYGNTSPLEKSQIVQDIKRDLHGNMAWVGDGINDIVAGGTSDISFSVFNANDINSFNSSVCLLAPDLTLVSHTLFLAKKARINIIENYIWAFGYNVIMIPLALFGIINATIAGIGMSISSIIVVLNALRLRFIKRRK